MKVTVTIILLVLTVSFSSTVRASTKIEQYQQQISSNLKQQSTDMLVWVRAYNNTYNKFCKNHHTYEHYNLFFEVASKTIVGEMVSRDDWNTIWDAKYGYRKGLLIGLRKRIGNDGYCTCIYNHIMKGNSACLNQ